MKPNLHDVQKDDLAPSYLYSAAEAEANPVRCDRCSEVTPVRSVGPCFYSDADNEVIICPDCYEALPGSVVEPSKSTVLFNVAKSARWLAGLLGRPETPRVIELRQQAEAELKEHLRRYEERSA